MNFFLKFSIFVLAILNILICYDFPFFWDHIALVSKFANYFYDSPTAIPIVTPELDHGHPTFFSIYLCSLWQLFGRNLLVSHLAMFPFLILLGFQWLQTANLLLDKKYVPIAFFAILFEPTFLAQSTMVSTEIPLLAGILMCLNGVLYNKNSLKFWGLLLCGWLSIRGGMWCAVIFLTDFFNSATISKQSEKENKFWLLPYLVAGFLVLSWYVYHYSKTGYLLASPNAGWSSDYEWTFSFSLMLYKTKMLIWNIGDYGRFFYFGLIGISLIFSIFNNKIRVIFYNKKNQILMYFLVSTALVYFPVMIFRGNNNLRRYLIPFYLIALLLFIILFIQLNNKWLSFSVIGLAFTLLFSGHFWIYPERLSQDWEASLAHIPYFELDKKMKNHLNEHKISYNEVTTGFPNYNSALNTYLENDNRELIPIRNKANSRIKRYDEYPFLINSNIFNAFPANEMEKIKNIKLWKPVQRFEKGGIYIELLENQQL